MDKSKFNIKSEWKKFGIALGIILSIVATVLLLKKKSIYIYFYGSGLFFILAALTVPIVVKPVFILFLYIAFVLGWVMTRVILSVLFYLAITPIGLILKFFGKRFLDLKFSRKKASYWLESAVEASKEEGVKSYENQF